MGAAVRAGLGAVLAMLVGASTGCSSYDVETIERVLVLQDRDLTAAGPLRADQGQTIDARIAAIGLPLAAPSDRRLCGGMVGNTKLPDGTNREAIRSSAEAWTDSKFFLTFSGTPGGTLERQLFQASARHDFCYIHGVGTSGRNRADCDRDFFADIDRLCRGSDELAAPGPVGGIEDDVAGATCRSRAFWMKAAVDVFGGMAHSDNLVNTCDYDAGAHPPRDQLVAGRFLTGRNDQQMLEIRAVRDLGRLELVLHVHDGGTWRRSQPAFLDLTAIELREGETGGPLRCNDKYPCPTAKRSPDRLSDLFNATQLLSYPPTVMNVDGSGVDSVVLLGLHVDRSRKPFNEFKGTDPRTGKPRMYQPGWGPVFVPVKISARLQGGAYALAVEASAFRPAGPRTDPGEAKGDLRSNVDRFQHRLHVAKVFQQPVTVGDQTCGAGQQLVAPYLGTARYNRGQVEVRTFEFCVAAGRLRRMVSYNWVPEEKGPDGKFHHKPGFWGSPDNDDHFELYKRFQHPPRMMAVGDGVRAVPAALHFIFRRKCDGPNGSCSGRSNQDLFDLDDMLVQRLVPVSAPRRGARVPTESDRPPFAPRTLSWHMFDWGAQGSQGCFDKAATATLANAKPALFGCFVGWDRLGHPLAPIMDPLSGPAPLLGAFLTNCAIHATDPRGTCDNPKGAPQHERLRLVLTHPAATIPGKPVFVDLDSPRLRTPAETAEPRLAASYRTYPTLVASFGGAGSGLVFLRAGNASNLRDTEAWTVNESTQFQPDPGKSVPRNLRLLAVATRIERGTRIWQAAEYVCELPPPLMTRRWPLRAVPALVLDGRARSSTIVLAIRTDANDLAFATITFDGLAPKLTPHGGAGRACVHDAEAGWTIERSPEASPPGPTVMRR